MYPSQAQQRAALSFSGGQPSLQMAAVRAQYQQVQQQQATNQVIFFIYWLDLFNTYN
jgi:hypothetical protein